MQFRTLTTQIGTFVVKYYSKKNLVFKDLKYCAFM